MNIKKELMWGLGITLIVVALTVYYIINFQNKTTKKPTITTPIKSENVTLTTSEIDKHNLESDCWFIVENKVYDATSYISSHPRGQQLLVPYCGGDATEAYQTKGGEGTHSQKANDDLTTLYIGDLNGQKTK